MLTFFTCRLWEEGWKERYYSKKFNIKADDHEFRRQLVQLNTLLYTVVARF